MAPPVQVGGNDTVLMEDVQLEETLRIDHLEEKKRTCRNVRETFRIPLQTSLLLLALPFTLSL